MFHKVQITAQRPGPHLLITGGIHGDEFEPMSAIRQLHCLLDDSTIEPNLVCGRLTLVPVVNEPAFLRGHRTAEDGLDLARTCPGDRGGSITERIAFALAEVIKTADFYIDLHTGGTELSVWPMTGYTLHQNGQVLEMQRSMAAAFNLPIIWGTSPDLDGRSLSVARDANIPAIYAEYLGAAQWRPQGSAAYVEGCLNVMSLLRMIASRTPEPRVEYTVEDTQPESGHMQICNPSPADGFFEPAVELGGTIRAGQALGTVIDSLGHHRHTINAQHSGIVLVLRTFPRVLQGQTVGVVLEVKRQQMGH